MSILDDNLDIDLKSFANNKLYDYCTKPYSWWDEVLSKCYINGGYGVKLIEFENIGTESLNNYYIKFAGVDFYNGMVMFKCVEKCPSSNLCIKNQNTKAVLTLENLLVEF